jgi:hypothetical protein
VLKVVLTDCKSPTHHPTPLPAVFLESGSIVNGASIVDYSYYVLLNVDMVMVETAHRAIVAVKQISQLIPPSWLLSVLVCMV